MLLRFFIVITVYSICIITAHPSRLKILPGLAFYRTDDSHDEQDNSLMDKDKDLLRSMWNIVDKMDYKSQTGDSVSNPVPSASSQEHERVVEPMRKYMSGYSTPTPLIHKQERPMHAGHPKPQPGPHGTNPQGKIPPLGTPITTINVYSSYPAAAMKPSTTYRQVPSYQEGNIPFSSTHNQNIIPPPSPRFEPPKQYGPPMGYDQPSPPQDVNMAQYVSEMTANLGQPFENPIDRAEKDDGMQSGFDTMNQDGMGQYGAMVGMENQAGSEPMPYLMPQMGEESSYGMMNMNMGGESPRQMNY